VDITATPVANGHIQPPPNNTPPTNAASMTIKTAAPNQVKSRCRMGRRVDGATITLPQ
jgi:hypothetical protein